MNKFLRLLFVFMTAGGLALLHSEISDEAWNAMVRGDGGASMVQFFRENPDEVAKNEGKAYFVLRVPCAYVEGARADAFWFFLSFMHAAAAYNAPALLEYLICEKGMNPDISQKQVYESMPIKTEQAQVVFTLQSNNGEYDGATPLFFALLKGHMNIVRQLLAHGASLTRRIRWDIDEDLKIDLPICFAAITDLNSTVGREIWEFLTERQKTELASAKSLYYGFSTEHPLSIFKLFSNSLQVFSDAIERFFLLMEQHRLIENENLKILDFEDASIRFRHITTDDRVFIETIRLVPVLKVFNDFIELLERFDFVASFEQYVVDPQVRRDYQDALKIAYEIRQKHHKIIVLLEQDKAKKLFLRSHDSSMYNSVMQRPHLGSTPRFSMADRISSFAARKHGDVGHVLEAPEELAAHNNGEDENVVRARLRVHQRELSYLDPNLIIGPLYQRTLRPRT